MLLIKFFFQIIHAHFPFYNIQLSKHTDDQFQTSLHLASAEGHDEIVEYLLHQGANISSLDMNDSTPLHQAAAHNRYSCVKLLLSFQAPINPLDSKHWTPLHHASQFGHWQIVRLLLDHHVDVQLRTFDGYNSFELAILNHHQRTVGEFLRDRTWKNSLRNIQKDLSTPLRKLIRYMPNRAEEIFNKCMIEYGQIDELTYKIDFNYEFLEDQLSILSKESSKMSLLRQNHPLYLIITSHHYDLLKHPLINQLIKRKWRQFTRTFFWMLFLFYGKFNRFDILLCILSFSRFFPSFIYNNDSSCSSSSILLFTF